VQLAHAVPAVSARPALAEPVPHPPRPPRKTLAIPPASTSDPATRELAQGDENANDTFSYVISHSYTTEIYIENEGE
jgi:hypothetical protein